MPTNHAKLCLLIAASLAVSGCAQQSREEAPSPASAPDKPMNCLFIVLDAFHAAKSSLYGYPEPTTPHLEKWAKQGIVFEDATSQFTSTSGSSWSYLNGLHPYRSSPFNPMRDTDVPLPLLFKDQGYRTGSFSDNPYISKTQGLDKGYSHFEYHYYQKWRKDAKNGSSPPSGDRERSEFLFDQLEKWIHNGDTDPWFAYIHTLRPHNTYAPPEPYLSKFADTNLVPENEDSREYLIEYERKIFHRFLLEGRGSISDEQRDMLHDMYLSSINYIDHLIDNLFSSLQEAGQLENTLIIITSDHGEAFGEHGRFLHGGTPHRPLNHVPLIIIPPKHMNLKPIRVSTPVPLLDLLPTLTEIFQLSDPTPRDGQSLTPLMRGDQGYENKPIFSQSPFELAVIKDNRKLIIKTRDQIINLSGEESIVPTETEIFDLNADPQENNNLYQPGNDYPILMALRESYLDRQGTISTFEIPVLPDEEREALESLGYLDK